MTREKFIYVMKQYCEILGKARKVLENHGIKDITCVDEVSLDDDGGGVIIDYTWKWDWEYVQDSLVVGIDEFCE